MFSESNPPAKSTAALVLADGRVFWGRGVGQHGQITGEVCFNTSLTGYQEILTDPSYAGQIVTFTFPHIGNTGTNSDDVESDHPVARGLILRTDITNPSNWRSTQGFADWLVDQNLTGICGIDTRALTRHLRDHGAQNGIICFPENGQDDIDIEQLKIKAALTPTLAGQDLAKTVTCATPYTWTQTQWDGEKYGEVINPHGHIVVIDYGVKKNILRGLASQGYALTVVPCTSSVEEILSYNPDGIFLSNGPGDPAATGTYAVPVIQKLIETGLPVFGICLGHQMLALALGARTEKMAFGHRGGNHPVKNIETGQVEITSQNHGFHVIADSLPDTVTATHTSLFDGTNEGLSVNGRPVFSVQYHPEASPGPHDSHYLFTRFADLIGKNSLRKIA